MAVINVSAATETEMKEKKARVEDAMHATRAAVEEGIVPGEGVAYLRCLHALEKLEVSGGEKFGVDLVRRALEEPLRWIVANGGWEGSIVVNKMREGAAAFGFNAESGQYEDLLKAGGDRPHQGDALCATERVERGVFDAHHRGDRGRKA